MNRIEEIYGLSYKDVHDIVNTFYESNDETELKFGGVEYTNLKLGDFCEWHRYNENGISVYIEEYESEDDELIAIINDLKVLIDFEGGEYKLINI